MKAADFFTPEIQAEIVKAIKQAEAQTSGEIRLFVEDHCKDDVLDRAAFMFEKLEMHQTELRNGVLFYVSVTDKKFAIIGDQGINELVATDFWNATKEIVLNHFKQGAFKQGLVEGILSAGNQLKAYFPYQSDDEDELSNEISKSE